MIIAYDGFEGYSAGTQVESSGGVGLNGGTGFTGAYNVDDSNRAAALVSAKSLTYASLGINGGANALQVGGTTMSSPVENFLARGFASQSSTLYLSFLIHGTQAPADEDFLQIGLANSSGEPPASVGITGPTAGTTPMQFFLRFPSSTANQSLVASPTFTLTTTYLLVLKLSKVSSTFYNRAEFFFNPTTLSEPGSPTLVRNFTTTLPDISNFRVRLARFESTDAYFIDDLRVATTFAEAVPEPSGVVLLVLGWIGLVSRRRRS